MVLPKKTGAIRICVDLTPLNESIQHEVHHLPAVDDTLAQPVGQCKSFHYPSGFWQVPLTPSSRLPTTFLTPYAWALLIQQAVIRDNNAPKHFQKQMEKTLVRVEGVLCHINDILVFISKRSMMPDLKPACRNCMVEPANVNLRELSCVF